MGQNRNIINFTSDDWDSSFIETNQDKTNLFELTKIYLHIESLCIIRHTQNVSTDYKKITFTSYSTAVFNSLTTNTTKFSF